MIRKKPAVHGLVYGWVNWGRFRR